jgi:hypothetical protein
VAHGVRDITSWLTTVGATRSRPLVWDRHSVVPHGVMGLAPWATALGPSAVGHGGSRPASAVGHGARVWLPIQHQNLAKNVIIIQKKKERGKRRR